MAENKTLIINKFWKTGTAIGDVTFNVQTVTVDATEAQKIYDLILALGLPAKFDNFEVGYNCPEYRLIFCTNDQKEMEITLIKGAFICPIRFLVDNGNVIVALEKALERSETRTANLSQGADFIKTLKAIWEVSH